MSATVEFDPFSAAYFEDPYPIYTALRENAPVYRHDDPTYYALSRWQDVIDASRDWETFSSARGIDLATLVSGRPPDFEGLIMIDPPRHTRMRNLVSRVFTPRAVAALEPMVREVIAGYFDRVEGRDNFDFIVDICGPFPVDVISRMLGVPEDMRQQVRHWLDVALTRQVGRMTPDAESFESMVKMGAYFYELAVDKRAHPGDDMISRLIATELPGEDGSPSRLDDTEIAAFGALLGGAGAETVTKLMGNAAVLFDTHRDQWAEVIDDHALIPGAIEEVLRMYPPSQYQGRCTTRDVELHGTVIPADAPVLLLTGAATRDPRAFEDPDRFDIHRDVTIQVGFGYGIHRCLGAALARLEGRIALEELSRRHPNFTVDHDGLRRVQMINVAGYSHVPIGPG